MLFTGPLTVVGAWIGERVYRALEDPVRNGAVWLVSIGGVAMPFVTGVEDIVLRRVTP